MSRRARAEQKPFTEVQKLKLDLNAAGRLMMRDPNYIMAVAAKFQRYNPMSLFGIALTGAENGIDMGWGVSKRGWDESVLKWRLVDYRRPPIEILNDSTVPNQGDIKPGVTFTLGVSEGYLEPDAIVETENPNYRLYCVGKKSSGNKISYYDFQYNGSNPNDTSFPRALLTYGRKLSFNGQNAVGERSAKGQSALLRQNGYEEYYNLMQTMRTDADISGHLLSTHQWTVLYDQFKDGSQTREVAKGAIPFASEVWKQHFEAISSTLYDGRTNLDVANKRILNQSPNGTYNDRPTASGLREFYNGTEHQYEYNPRQPDKLIGLLRQATTIVRDRMRNIDPNQVLDFKIITRNGGETAVREAWSNYLVRGNQQIHVTPGSNNRVMVGYGIDGFTTDKGDTFRLMNIDYALPRDTVRERATVNGYTADKDSWEIAIIPQYSLKDNPGRTNVQVVTKKHTLNDGTVINRGLVVGAQMGMTGLTNSTGQDIGAMQTADITKAYMDSYRVDSMIDQQSFGLLSELSMAVYDPDDIILLKPKFPASVY